MSTRIPVALSLLVASACGPAAPELYNFALDAIITPDTCFTTAPASKETAAPPTGLQASVWDGVSGDAFMEITSGGFTLTMGLAPSVVVGGTLKGRHGSGGWTFTSDKAGSTAQASTSIASESKFSFTFERSNAFKGTFTANSATSCSGSTCQPSQSSSCDLGTINLEGSRVAVTYQTNP